MAMPRNMPTVARLQLTLSAIGDMAEMSPTAGAAFPPSCIGEPLPRRGSEAMSQMPRHPLPPQKPLDIDDVRARVDAISDAMAGGLSLTAACELPGMPTPQTVWTWCKRFPEVEDQIAIAALQRADRIADEIIAIADTDPDPHKARVRIDARKWVASKMSPDRYGKRVMVPGEVRIKLTDAQLDARINQFLRKAGLPDLPSGAGAEGEAE